MRKASVTWSLLAPPPTSRKLAGSPPWYLMMSMVLMARPAPLTRQPMLPVEADEAEPRFGGPQLGGVFLGFVAQLFDIGMAKEGVVVERHLGVERLNFALGCDHERIDLREAAILVEKHLRQARS